MADMQDGHAAGRWATLDKLRHNHLNRQRKCAELTIPYLLPPEGHEEDHQLETPYQSLGARAVNNLASKLILTLFPPNTPFFKLSFDPATMEVLTQELGDEGVKTKVNKKLSMVEQFVLRDLEVMAARVYLYRLLRLLIVTGEVLLEMPDKKYNGDRMKVYRLDRFVLRRNPRGELKEIIIQEFIEHDEIPEDIEYTQQDRDSSGNKTIPLYTYMEKRGKKWQVYQEVCGQIISNTMGEFTDENLPFLPISWVLPDGENYGRSHVEEYLGDFMSLEGLNRALLEGAAAAAKLVVLVDPNGTTQIDDLKKAPNGGFAAGNDEDISVIQVQKLNDFKTAYDQAQVIERRLGYAFLLNEAIQRDAERVTAEEIRFMAEELNNAIGGIYTMLALNLQLPFVRKQITKLRKDKKLPKFPTEVEPTITAGFEGLGRGHDLSKLREFLGNLAPLGEQTIATYLMVSDYIKRVATALGLDTDGLVATDEEVAAKQKQAQQQALVQQLGPEAIKMIGKGGGPQQGGQPQ